MAIDVEANMKIPRLTIREANQPDKVIDNSLVRFIKRIQVPAIPKPGSSLTLTASGGQTFESTVTRADWHEEKEMFVVSCSYAKRSISADDYHALVNDPEWTVKPLVG
jgi:hypothetical protein